MQADDEVAWPDDAIEVARVTDAWGIKGWIRVHPYSAQPHALFSSRRWFVQPPAEPGPKRELPRLLRIRQAREHSGTVVACADELPDRSAAEAMRGARIFVSRASFPTPAQGEYYWIDLIGLSVVNREGQALGDVADLIDTGPHSVLKIVQESTGPNDETVHTERMVPFVSAYVDDVDLAARRITVDWGLDY